MKREILRLSRGASWQRISKVAGSEVERLEPSNLDGHQQGVTNKVMNVRAIDPQHTNPKLPATVIFNGNCLWRDMSEALSKSI